MDLSSLPDDMITSTLKYLDYRTINRLRRMNKRLNKIAKARDLGIRFPVTSLICSESHEKTHPWQYSLLLDYSAVNCHIGLAKKYERNFSVEDVSHLDFLDMLLKKIELLGDLAFENFPYKLDDDLLSVFWCNRKSIRKMREFRLRDTDVNCSHSLLRNFFAFSKYLKVFDICIEKTNRNALLQREILENRKWLRIDLDEAGIDSKFEYATLNDDFLLNVVRNCKMCCVRFFEQKRRMFTANGVIRLIELLIRDGISPTDIDLGAVFSKLSFDEVENKIRSISGMDRNGISVKTKYDKFVIRFSSDPDVCNILKFTLQTEQEE